VGFLNKKSCSPDPEQLLQTIATFIQAESWNESQRILEQYPELLTDEANALLSQLADTQETEGARQTVETHRALLRRCREVGVERAFAERTDAADSGSAVPEQFLADLRQAQAGLQRYLQTGDLPALNGAVSAWERILNHSAFSQADERFRLAAWNNAGGAYLRRYEATGNLEDLDTATHLWNQAIAATPQGFPDWARGQANLGVALIRRFEALGQVADLDAAIAADQKALGAGARLQAGPDRAAERIEVRRSRVHTLPDLPQGALRVLPRRSDGRRRPPTARRPLGGGVDPFPGGRGPQGAPHPGPLRRRAGGRLGGPGHSPEWPMPRWARPGSTRNCWRTRPFH
jgi:tetratricopeptide (TPR) repeat protein